MTDFDEVKLRAERFAGMVDRKDVNGCWPFTGSGDPRGYGRFYVGKARIVRAHRTAWMLAHDQPIPTGLLVCHSCDNPPCCNPAHLWLGTDADNNRDRAAKGRTISPPRDPAKVNWATGERHGSAKLTGDQAAVIRNGLAAGLSLGKLAKAHGVTKRTVSRIRDGLSWAPDAILSQAPATAGEEG